MFGKKHDHMPKVNVPPAMDAAEAARIAFAHDLPLSKHHFVEGEHPVVRIEHLMKTFDGETQVLRDVNLNVWNGEIVVVLGPSGSGKSTMLRCINLLETPTAGHILIDDDEITGRERAGLALAIGAGHIVNNLIYPDVWFEPSLRLTGELISRSRDMEWNFVVGMRFHASPDVRNVLFCEILRNRIDRHYYGWHPLRNTSLEYRLDLSPSRLLKTGEVYGDGAVNNTLLVGKRWPVRRGRNTLGLKLGAGYQWSNGYSGRMKRASEPGWTFLMRPMFSF